MNKSKLNWVETKNRLPKNHDGFNPPFINCIVYACNPSQPVGGVVASCRWDVDNKCWLGSDIKANWCLQEPYVITHYVDDYESPYSPLCIIKR